MGCVNTNPRSLGNRRTGRGGKAFRTQRLEGRMLRSSLKKSWVNGSAEASGAGEAYIIVKWGKMNRGDEKNKVKYINNVVVTSNHKQ